MWFGILGPTQVQLADGRRVAVGGPRLRALLALLLLDAGQVVTAERLIDGLYGEHPPSGATNALQSQVSRLRHLLRDQDRTGALAEFHPAGYRLAVDPADVDAHRFERLVAEGRRAVAVGDHRRAAPLLREALALWRGPALADARDAPFAQAQAARLEELRLGAIEDRAEAELALGRHRGLVAELQQLVTAHPLRERLRGQLMRALYGAGRQAEALTVFEDARRTLAEELGADPSAELAAVHLDVLRADPGLTAQVDLAEREAIASLAKRKAAAPSAAHEAAARLAEPEAHARLAEPEAHARLAEPEAAAPPAEREATWQGLPAQLTTFVGRTEEVARVGKLLGEARLVTLVGAGGAGKTRLAIEAAGRAPGEVCFVELAPLGDGAEVPQAVLGALGLREAGLLPPVPGHPGPRPDLTGRLDAALADRRMLLVLDNCEHVVEAAARLSHRLLSASPTLRVLATSREPLGITGETLCPVPPLPLPPPDTTPEEALGSPAVRLFADRAAAVRPDFTVDAGNADDVLRICRALDGLPLAIELAAARLRSLPLAEVAARLDDRFRLLSRGDRTAEPRHHTLRAVVEWSWDLLDDAERLLARRLTVFVGGATLEAAERVCGLPATEVVEVLTSLVDKSLVEAAGEDGRRYRMLETVRAFCAERLAEAGEQEDLYRAHAAHFLGLAQTADPHLRRAEQLEWLRRLDAEHDDLLAALRRSVQVADTRTALRLIAALSSYWWMRGLRSEAMALAGALLDALGPAPPSGLEEEYALCVLNVALGGSSDPELRTHLEAVEAVMLASDQPFQQPFLNVLLALTIGPPSDDVAQVLSRRIGPDPWLGALTQFGWGYQRLLAGAVAEADHEFAAALAAFRTLGERWATATVLTELADLARWRGDWERAAALTDEALDLCRQLDAVEDSAQLLCRRAVGSIGAGDLAEAEADYERAAELARRAGAQAVLAGADSGLGDVARLRGDLAEARRRCEKALAECPAGWYVADETRASILVALGRIAEAEQDAGQARAWYRRALGAGHGAAPDAAEGLAGVALLEGDGEQAALLLGVGKALRGTAVAGDPDVARVSAAARAQVGPAAYERAYQQGAAMPRDQALTLIGAPPSASGA